MASFTGRKLIILLAVFSLSGGFLFSLMTPTAEAYHNAGTYLKASSSQLDAGEWNDIFKDFVNTWLPATMSGPLGIGFGSAPSSGLSVNGNVGIGVSNPLGTLHVSNASGTNALFTSSNGSVGFGTNLPSPNTSISVQNQAYFAGPVVLGQILPPGGIVMATSDGLLYATSTVVGMPPATLTGQTLHASGTGWLSDAFLYNNGSSVGIGTTAPGARLGINATGTALTNPALSILGSGPWGSGYQIAWGNYAKFSQNSSGSHYISWGMHNNGSTWVRDYTGASNYLSYIGLPTNERIEFGGATSNSTSDASPTLSPKMTIDTTSGNVGIGTTNPQASLDIANSAQLTGLNISMSGSTGSVIDTTYGLKVLNNRGGGNNGPYRYGGYFETQSYTSSANYNYGLVGVGNKVGGYGYSATGVLGVGRHTYNSYSTASTNLIGVQGQIDFTDDSIALSNSGYGASLYTNAVVPANKTLATYYGLYMSAPTGSGTITSKFGIYQNDSNSPNYFSGNVGIGTTIPKATLHVSNASSTNALFVSSNGSVGFGTSLPLPNTSISVQNQAYFAGPVVLSQVMPGGIIMATTDGLLYATSSAVATGIPLPTGAAGSTLYSNGTNWVAATSPLYNNGTNIGIGTTNPGSQLNVVSQATVVGRGLILDQYSTDAAAALNVFRKARGTLASPTTVSNGDYIGAFGIRAYDGSSFIDSAGFGAKVNGTVSAGSVPQDLYFYTASTNQTDPYAAGTIRMVINSSGNVGIGTTNPTARLEVKSSGYSTYPQAWDSFDGSVLGYLYETYDGNSFFGLNDATGTASIVFRTDDGNNYIRNGNLGIGLTNPAAKLQVSGNGTTSAIFYNGNVGIGTTSTGPKDAFSISSNTGASATSSSDRTGHNFTMGYVSDDTYALVNIGYLTSVVGTANSSTSWKLGGNTMSGENKIGTLSAYDLPFITNSTEKMRITTGGNVGLGTSAPSAKLEVVSTDYNVLTLNQQSFHPINFLITDEPLSVGYDANIGSLGWDPSGFKLKYGSASSQWGDIIHAWDSGNVGIGTTAPKDLFSIASDAGTSAPAGSPRTGHNYTDTYLSDDPYALVNVGYLQSVVGTTSSSSTSWKLGGNTVSTSSPIGTLGGFSLPFITSSTERMRITNSGYVGVGTTNPGGIFHIVSGTGYTAIFQDTFSGNSLGYIGNGGTFSASGQEFGLYVEDFAVADTYRLASYDYESKLMIYGGGSKIDPYLVIKHDTVNTGFVGIGTSAPTSKLEVAGPIKSTGLSIVGGGLAMNTGDITGVNKLTVNTIDPLYTIKGINYSTFASSIAGGTKEEYVGKIKLVKTNKTAKESEAVIDFSKIGEGSDLWLWRKVIDFNKDNVEVLISPYGKFASVYYIIKDNQIIFRADKPVEISYRLIGKRFDWRQWPTLSEDQTSKGMKVE